MGKDETEKSEGGEQEKDVIKEKVGESISDLWEGKSVGVSPSLPWEPALPEH